MGGGGQVGGSYHSFCFTLPSTSSFISLFCLLNIYFIFLLFYYLNLVRGEHACALVAMPLPELTWGRGIGKISQTIDKEKKNV